MYAGNSFVLHWCISVYTLIPRWKSRFHASIYKRHSTVPVVNKERRWKVVLMPVLIQYRFPYWHGKDAQYLASTDGQLPAKLPSEAAPVEGRAHTSTAPVLNKYRFQCWHGTDVQYRWTTSRSYLSEPCRWFAVLMPASRQYWTSTDLIAGMVPTTDYFSQINWFNSKKDFSLLNLWTLTDLTVKNICFTNESVFIRY